MRDPDLGALNLNALVVLDALLATRNVRRAAGRLGVTPSAVSHALKKLRADLGDELVVRVGNRMVPTPRAEVLAEPLRRALLGLEAALNRVPAFDPASAERRFVVAASDAVTTALLPPLLRKLASEAPGIDLDFVPVDPDAMGRALEAGALDLAVAPAVRAEAGLRSRALLSTGFTVLACAEHPELRELGRLDLDAYCRLPHVVVAGGRPGVGPVDDALARLGRARRVALRVSSFLAAPHAVVGTRLLLTCPTGPAERLARRLPLRSYAAPLPLPTATVSLVWHERVDADPGHAWMRGVIALAAQEA